MKGGRYLAALSALAFLLIVSAATPPAGPAFLLFDISKEGEYPPKAPVGHALAEAGLILAGDGSASNTSAAMPITLMVERGRIARPSHAKKLFDDLHRIDPSGGEDQRQMPDPTIEAGCSYPVGLTSSERSRYPAGRR